MKAPSVIGMALAAVLAAGAQSVSSYRESMQRGEELRAARRWEEAVASYREAAGRAADLPQAARAQYRVALTYEDMQDFDAALLWYRASLQSTYYSETADAIKRLENTRLSRVVTAVEIARGLNLPPSRSQGISPSIDLPINFDFDRDTLTEEGGRQVAELARALADPAFVRDRFALVGHTDKRGTEEYNLALSERRARRVAGVLHDQFGFDPARFDPIGMGKKQLLSDGDTEDDQRLNRRVEVKRLGGAATPPRN
jgi:outer membrane protein OmpA-like peptidoglycan-associated protein